MTLEEAKAIVAKAAERELPIYGPQAMDEGLCFEVEGSFNAEEFEAMALVLRDAERR